MLTEPWAPSRWPGVAVAVEAQASGLLGGGRGWARP